MPRGPTPRTLHANAPPRAAARAVMSLPLVVAILSQLAYSASDLLARSALRDAPLALRAFVGVWFVGFLLLRTFALAGQLFVFATMDLGRTAVLFGAASIVLANVLGLLLLQEVLSPGAYAGVVLAVAAFAVIGLAR